MLKDALASAEVSGDHWYQAELYRLKGRLLVDRSLDDESQACFQRAIEVSRGQRAMILELRAVTSLDAWFTEGFDTRDLKDAKSLLDAL